MRFLVYTFKSLTKFELILWGSSVLLIIISFIFTGNNDYWTLSASLIGATALIFIAKGNVLGHALTLIFALLYGVVSFYFEYFGEMITTLGITAPIAAASLISWLKNPHKGNKADVQINSLKISEYVLTIILSFLITVVFYFILKALDTKNLLLSTIATFTSIVPGYLTVRRSRFYAAGYAVNDAVIIVLWLIATAENLKYLSMVLCFLVFFVNDIYGFIKWTMNRKRQKESEPAPQG